MENFDLKKYLAEGRLLKEEIMVDTITMFGGMNYLNDVIASPEDYGFDETFAEWIKNNVLTAPKTMSMDDHMDLQNAFVMKGGIEVGGGGDYDHIFDAIDLQVKQGKLTPKEGEQAKKIALNYSNKPGDGYKKYLAENRLLKEDNLKDYWPEWAAGEVKVGNENVIDAGGVDADFENVPNETMNTFKDYVKAVKALNADSKELRNDIAGAVSMIIFSGGDFEDYDFDVLTADQFAKIQDII